PPIFAAGLFSPFVAHTPTPFFSTHPPPSPPPPLSLPDALPISHQHDRRSPQRTRGAHGRTSCRSLRPPASLSGAPAGEGFGTKRSEEHTSELQSRRDLVCRLLLEKKKKVEKKT